MIVSLLALTLLSACATSPISTCPEPTKVEPKVQERAAVELSELPEDSALAVVVEAGLNDRDKLRACRSIR